MSEGVSDRSFSTCRKSISAGIFVDGVSVGVFRNRKKVEKGRLLKYGSDERKLRGRLLILTAFVRLVYLSKEIYKAKINVNGKNGRLECIRRLKIQFLYKYRGLVRQNAYVKF